MKKEWSDEWPLEPGWYWFYGIGWTGNVVHLDVPKIPDVPESYFEER